MEVSVMFLTRNGVLDMSSKQEKLEGEREKNKGEG